MALDFDWLGRNEIDRIARIRWQCYGGQTEQLEGLRKRSNNGSWGNGDVCVASTGGVDVGTATTLWQHLHVRAKRVPCQGIAWVGTSKSHRRRADGRGVATQVMQKLIERGRERGAVASVLMPFRASFYEHFGYGVVERQAIWRVPIALLPTDAPGDFRFGDVSDAPAMVSCRARMSLTGQCDVETSDVQLAEWFSSLTPDTQLFVDESGGQISDYTWVRTVIDGDQQIAHLVQPAWDGLESLRRLLTFCSGLKDQYSAVQIVLPADFPLNWLLRERQVPHRRVDHAAATCKLISRMQLRVFDHVKFLDGQHVFSDCGGAAVVSVKETEGHESRFRVEIGNQRVSATPSTASPDVTCTDVTWAAIASGELRASTASAMGLLEGRSPAAIRALNVLTDGPLPFCHEYF